jgi:hypothetical protein
LRADEAKNSENETNRFAKRKESSRAGDLKLLKSLWAPNQQFRGIVCFNGLTLVSFRAVLGCALSGRLTVGAKASADGNPGIIANNSDNGN